MNNNIIEQDNRIFGYSNKKLIETIETLELYPSFESAVEKLKKILLERFEDIKISKTGHCKILDRNIKYYPNGLVLYVNIQDHMFFESDNTYYNIKKGDFNNDAINSRTTLPPYEYNPIIKEEKKDFSQEKVYKEILTNLTYFYRFICYKQLGYKINRKDRVKKDLFLESEQKIKNILKEKIPFKLKRELCQKLLEEIKQKFGKKDLYDCILGSSYKINSDIYEEFIEKTVEWSLNNAFGLNYWKRRVNVSIKRKLQAPSLQNQNIDIINMMKKKFMVKILIINNKMLFDCLKEKQNKNYYNYSNFGKSATDKDHYIIHFNNLAELFEGIEEYGKKYDLEDVLYKLGFVNNITKETKKSPT